MYSSSSCHISSHICNLRSCTSSKSSFAAFSTPLTSRRCLDPWFNIVLVCSSNFSTPTNSSAISMIPASLFELSLQGTLVVFCRESQLIQSVGYFFPFHPGSLVHLTCRENSEPLHPHQSGSSATWSSHATLPTTSSKSSSLPPSSGRRPKVLIQKKKSSF